MLLLRRQSKVLSSLQYFAANLVSRAFLPERDGRGLGKPWISNILAKICWLIDCFIDLLIYLFNNSFKGSRFQNIPWGIWRDSSEFGILRGMTCWLIDRPIDLIQSVSQSVSRFGPNSWARNRFCINLFREDNNNLIMGARRCRVEHEKRIPYLRASMYYFVYHVSIFLTKEEADLIHVSKRQRVAIGTKWQPLRCCHINTLVSSSSLHWTKQIILGR